MLPLSDGVPTRRLPIVTVAIIVANFAVWPFDELPHLRTAVFHASFYPSAMFLHGSWDHILDNMLFLAVFGKSVEEAANGGGVAFFAHVGGFLFGAIVARILVEVGQVAPGDGGGALRAPA